MRHSFSSPGWQTFIALLQTIEQQDELDRLLDALLTTEERIAIGHRIEIIASLLVGRESQRELAGRLQVGIATITRGSNMLKRLPENERDFLTTLLTSTGGDDGHGNRQDEL